MTEDMYRTVFESSDQGICVLEVIFDETESPLDLRVLTANPMFEVQTGITDAIGKRVRELVPELEEHWFTTYGDVALTGEPRRFESLASALGRSYEVYAFRVGAPSQRRVGVIFRDISARKRAEAQRAEVIEQLSEAQESLRADLAATARLLRVGSLFLKEGNLSDVLGEIVEAAMEICSADFGNIQLLKHASGTLEIVAQRNFPDFWLRFWSVTHAGCGTCGTALQRQARTIVEDVETSPVFAATPGLDVQRKAGVRAVQSTPLIGRSGETIGVLSTHWRRPTRPDGRTLRHLDLLARQAADILERAHAEQALAGANQRLREADLRKDEFLAMLSHELRNPLVPIRNGLEILRRAPPGSEQAERAQSTMERQVEHMTRIIDDLLDLTRITRGTVVLQREPLDLVELTERVVRDYRSLFEQSGVNLGFSTNASSAWVRGDRTRLQQVVGNLLQNAAKFTPEGGRATVTLSVDEAAKSISLRVEDTGRGIAQAILPHVFEAFMQADISSDREKGGLGLGLSVVETLVRMHGGSARAESAGPGAGAAFTVSLPADNALAAREPETRMPSQVAPRRVLIVEDNLIVAMSFTDVLSLEGHTVETAADGREGLEKARAMLPDVVFCDIGLPGMDGYAVARAMRADPSLNRVLLVALTGYSHPDDVEKAHAAGFDAHLTKPASPRTIAQLLARSASGASPSPPRGVVQA